MENTFKVQFAPFHQGFLRFLLFKWPYESTISHDGKKYWGGNNPFLTSRFFLKCENNTIVNIIKESLFFNQGFKFKLDSGEEIIFKKKKGNPSFSLYSLDEPKKFSFIRSNNLKYIFYHNEKQIAEFRVNLFVKPFVKLNLSIDVIVDESIKDMDVNYQKLVLKLIYGFSIYLFNGYISKYKEYHHVDSG